MRGSSQRAWLPWASVIVLGLLCGVLGFLQYRWTGQITEAERSTLYDELRSRLAAFTRAFNEEIADASIALTPPPDQINAMGREAAYSAQYARWKPGNGRLFQRVALAVPDADYEDGGLRLLNLNLDTGQFSPAGWPPAWSAMREQLNRRIAGGGRGPVRFVDTELFEIPRFDGGRESEWLLLELNRDYIRRTVLPEMLNKYLGRDGRLDYDVTVLLNGDPALVIYDSLPKHPDILTTNADASAPMLDIRPPPQFGRASDRPVNRRAWGPGRPRGPGGPPPDAGPANFGPWRWRILVRHRAGSLEALVSQTRRRNLAISAGVLALIMATVAMLVRFSRQAQRLAELQIGFVAGVSHDLRTPVTVIRTCAYNLRSGRFRTRPDQVERYGQLIEAESEKLEALVEQVLRFASAEAGHVAREREPVAIGNLIEEELDSKRAALEDRHIVLEDRIGTDLPMVLADGSALRHALQNLLDNALKYGTKDSRWIGVYADTIAGEKGEMVEIRVADHGPGIPADERDRIFDAFFRGRRAAQDQVRGTGIGLNLVKKIIEAHGGAIHVRSEPGKGTEFIVSLPAMSTKVSA